MIVEPVKKTKIDSGRKTENKNKRNAEFFLQRNSFPKNEQKFPNEG